MPTCDSGGAHTAAQGLPRLFDVHQHVLPPAYLDALARAGIDPVREDGFPTPSWDELDACAFAEGANIGFSLFSISSPHVNWGDDAASAEVCRALNDYMSSLCASCDASRGFAAVLPLPDVASSIAEARRALALQGALGVKVPTNACGTYLGDPSLDPLIDTTRAVLNLVTEGVLDRYPNVRWVVPHCGAFVPEVAHRMDGISHVLVPAGMMSNVDVLLAVRSLYFDLAGDAEPVMLDALLKVADPTHLLYGSDWPYTPAPLALRKAEALFHGPHAKAIEGAAWQNAARLYGFRQVSL